MKTILQTVLVVVITISVISPSLASAAANYSNWSYSNSDQYYYTSSQQQASLETYIRQLEQLLAQLRAEQRSRNTNSNTSWNSNSGDVNVITRSADEIEDDMATLRSTVDFNNSDEAVVYFQWGTVSSRLTNETPNIVLDDRDDEDFSARVGDLDEDRTYYFRAVAEDDNGRINYGNVLSFRSDDTNRTRNDSNRDKRDRDYRDRSNEDWPDVETLGADNIRTSSAEVRGEVNMNDYRNGYVFLVFGEDEDMVKDVTDDNDEYTDIDTDGDDLQKTGVYSGLSTYRNFWTVISGLDEDTDIYYAYCVEFEDEDNDETIVCGDTESFTTDED